MHHGPDPDQNPLQLIELLSFDFSSLWISHHILYLLLRLSVESFISITHGLSQRNMLYLNT